MTRTAVVAHADEIQVGLLGQVRRRWGRCGVRIRQRVQRRRQYRSLFLAVDCLSGRVWHCWLDSVQGAEFCAVVRGMAQATEIAAVVWDGAPGHRDARVGRIGLPLVTLPPYSPECNPAERLNEVIRAETEGVIYPTLDAKCAAVDAILTRWDADPAEVRSLVGWHWIRAACDHLPLRTTS